jgi:hypothetical protein
MLCPCHVVVDGCRFGVQGRSGQAEGREYAAHAGGRHPRRQIVTKLMFLLPPRDNGLAVDSRYGILRSMWRLRRSAS